MLTRLQVQGFKNLLDIDVRFGPFTCVAGRNAVGKSNLFDAIRFLHLLAQHPILEAVRHVRVAEGRAPDLRSLFTTFGEFRAPVMRFTADLVIPRDVQDDYGVKAEAATSSVRYSVAFQLSAEAGTERLELIEETLSPLGAGEAHQNLGFPGSAGFLKSALRGKRGKRVLDLISTAPSTAGREIKVHGELPHRSRSLPASKASRTVVNGLASIDYPTILAVNHEMQSWQTLLLEPSAMRSPSPYSDFGQIDIRGGGLPLAVEKLRYLEKSEGQVYASLANKLSELIDDVREVRIRDDESSQNYVLEIRGRDLVFHPAASLSDGTLRFLVLAVLAITPSPQGVICLEEPENGIHPERIPAMIQLLKDIAVDPTYVVSDDNPLRQVIVNTHSPTVIGNVLPDEVIYLDTYHVVREGAHGRAAVVLVPSGTWRARSQGEGFEVAPGLLAPYLQGASSDQGEPWSKILEPRTWS